MYLNSDLKYNLYRFTKAHLDHYYDALSEIRQGHKLTDWIDFIFPHVIGVGADEKSEFYAIRSRAEAQAYLNNQYLCKHLFEITEALLSHKEKPIQEIFEQEEDIKKLRSCMTLFGFVHNEYLFLMHNDIFSQVIRTFLDKGYDARAYNITHSVPWHQLEAYEKVKDQVSDRATRQAEKELGLAEGEYCMGMCHLIWGIEKEILKNEYSIDWKTPSELDPDTRYD